MTDLREWAEICYARGYAEFPAIGRAVLDLIDTADAFDALTEIVGEDPFEVKKMMDGYEAIGALVDEQDDNAFHHETDNLAERIKRGLAFLEDIRL